LDISWLRTFTVAAELQNYRAAAERLYLSQPTVSVHVHLLEAELGTALFERRGRNVALTAAGRRFLRDAKRLVRQHDESIESLRLWQQGYAHTLRIGVSPLVATTFLPSVLRSFTNAEPTIDVEIRVIESPDIEDAILADTVEIGLGRLPARQRDVTSTVLYEDPVRCVATADDGGPAAGDLAAWLRERRLLTHNHPGYWDELLARIRRLCPLVRAMIVSQVHVTARLIGEGFGISFLPASSVGAEIRAGNLREIDTDAFGLALPIAATYTLSRWMLSPAAGRFIRHAEQLCKSLL
jgi:LysR family transcriptional repressor of citA